MLNLREANKGPYHLIKDLQRFNYTTNSYQVTVTANLT